MGSSRGNAPTGRSSTGGRPVQVAGSVKPPRQRHKSWDVVVQRRSNPGPADRRPQRSPIGRLLAEALHTDATLTEALATPASPTGPARGSGARPDGPRGC